LQQCCNAAIYVLVEWGDAAMKRVIIESPYAGDVEKHVRYAKRCAFDCLTRGEAPFASHLIYTEILDDNLPNERTLGIEAGYAWWLSAECVVFYTDYGWSKGMIAAYRRALELGKLVEFRTLWTEVSQERLPDVGRDSPSTN